MPSPVKWIPQTYHGHAVSGRRDAADPQANGRAEFGELFLSDVRIPAENMIGAENNGWRVAQATLASERGVISFEGGERQRYEIEACYRKSLKAGAAWLLDAQLHREFVSFLVQARWHIMGPASSISAGSDSGQKAS